MLDNKRIKFIFYLIFTLVVILLLRLAAKIDIHPDEAYYFSWSEFLRSGYLDHPPAIAYIIKLSSILFDGNFTIRGINLILILFSLFFIGSSISLINPDKSSLYLALIIILLSPLFLAGAIITTPDTPLIFFTSIYVYFSIRIFNNKTPYLMSLLSGIFLGLSFLSKYTAFMILISLLLFLIKYRTNRDMIIKAVIIPIIISFIIYFPNILYNIENNFKSYIFQISHATANPNFSPLKTSLPFILSQIFIFSPFVFICFFKNLNSIRKSIRPEIVLLYYIAIIPFTLLIFLSLFKHIEANWAVFGFIPVLILTANEIFSSRYKIISTLIYQLIVFILIILHINFAVLPLNQNIDPLTQIKYWKRTSELIQENLPAGRTVVTFRYQISSILYYYSNKKITSICLDKRFVNSEIGIMGAGDWVMIDFFPAKTATDIALNICPESISRIPLVISENINIIRRVDIIYCKEPDR